MEHKQKNGNIYITIAALLWSFSGAFTKLIPWGPISIACLRALICAVVFIIYRKTIKVTLNKYNIAGALAVFVTTLSFICANKYTTSANAIVLQYTMPIYIILYESLIRKNKPKALDIMAVTATFIGIAVFFIDSIGSGGMLGNIFALISGLAYSVLFLISSNKNSNPLEINFLGNSLYVVLIPFIFFDANFAITLPSVASILFLGIFQLGMGYICFSKGIQKTTAVSAAIIATLEPILNPVWALMLIKEKPSVLSVCAGIFVILVITLYNVLKEKNVKKQISQV